MGIGLLRSSKVHRKVQGVVGGISSFLWLLRDVEGRGCRVYGGLETGVLETKTYCGSRG